MLDVDASKVCRPVGKSPSSVLIVNQLTDPTRSFHLVVSTCFSGQPVVVATIDSAVPSIVMDTDEVDLMTLTTSSIVQTGRKNLVDIGNQIIPIFHVILWCCTSSCELR